MTAVEANGSSSALLKVTGIKKHFPIRSGILMRQTDTVYAVDGIDLEVGRGETIGLVGESGCGKSTLGRTLIRIYEPTSGEVVFNGQPFHKMSRSELRPHRKDIQMIFQDPYSSLNPRMTVARIIAEPLRVHTDLDREQRLQKVSQILTKVGLGSWALQRYPHEFSGGQRQRIAIARAIILEPQLIIADEPVSALDVSVQSQILNLMRDIQEEMGMSYLFIAHDLAVVKHMCQKIAVMYLGKIVEYASRDELFSNPLHPYTKALMDAIPVVGEKRLKDRVILGGDVPSPINPPSGCHFHPRCPYAEEVCRTKRPEVDGSAHQARCHLVEGGKRKYT